MSDVDDTMEVPGSLLESLNQTSQPKPKNPNGNGFPPKVSEDEPLAEWFKNFSGSQFTVTVERKSPETWEGHNVGGILGHFDELLDEEEIFNRYGGGKFQIRVMKHSNGRKIFAGARTFKVAGDPKITGEHFKTRTSIEPLVAAGSDESDSVSKRAMDMVERTLETERARMSRMEENYGGRAKEDLSPIMLAMVVDPYKTQIQGLLAQLAEKDRQLGEKDKTIHELSAKKPETTVQDTLLVKMYEGEGHKLEALRIQFESERRQLQESHAAEVKRIQDRHDYEIRSRDDNHKRELNTLEKSLESRIESMKEGFTSRLEAKDNRLKDLERGLTKAEVEVAELRAKKDKSPLDQIKELNELQSNLSALRGDDDDEPEQSTIERVVDKMVNSPVAQVVAAKLAQSQAQPDPNQVAQATADRKALIAAEIKRRKEAARKAEAPATPNAASPAQAEAIKGAIEYMEAAIKSNTPPETFAQSVRNMIPMDILSKIKEMGIDNFLDTVAKLEEGSPLTTQIGRNYARKVTKVLLRGTAEDVPEAG